MKSAGTGCLCLPKFMQPNRQPKPSTEGVNRKKLETNHDHKSHTYPALNSCPKHRVYALQSSAKSPRVSHATTRMCHAPQKRASRPRLPSRNWLEMARSGPGRGYSYL